ncbi:MAG: HEPN domain-containing protein [Chloroflexi bacterium]|nr:HEPN domain-containing protein [Chloroflexota bacterium]
MRPDVAAEVREWLERAADDLREAEHDLVAVPPLVRGTAFHSQQAAEKALPSTALPQAPPAPPPRAPDR